MEDCARCPLFELPAELRIKIYKYALWNHRWIDVDIGDVSGSQCKALLETHPKIKAECEPLLVHATIFNFRTAWPLTRRNIGPVRFAPLKQIVPNISEMWHIRIGVNTIVYHLDLSQGLKKHRFDVVSDSVSSSVEFLKPLLARGRRYAERAQQAQNKVDAMVVRTLAKGRRYLDRKVENAELRGEIPVMDLVGLVVLIQMIGKELDQAARRN